MSRLALPAYGRLCHRVNGFAIFNIAEQLTVNVGAYLAAAAGRDNAPGFPGGTLAHGLIFTYGF